jgi:hypothetical protein
VNFIRRSWGNNAADNVTAKQVAALREEVKDRQGNADIKVLEGK